MAVGIWFQNAEEKARRSEHPRQIMSDYQFHKSKRFCDPSGFLLDTLQVIQMSSSLFVCLGPAWVRDSTSASDNNDNWFRMIFDRGEKGVSWVGGRGGEIRGVARGQKRGWGNDMIDFAGLKASQLAGGSVGRWATCFTSLIVDQTKTILNRLHSSLAPMKDGRRRMRTHASGPPVRWRQGGIPIIVVNASRDDYFQHQSLCCWTLSTSQVVSPPFI